MPLPGTGVALVCAIKPAVTWGTPIAVGTGNAFRPTAFSIDDQNEDIQDLSYNGDVLSRQSDLVGRKLVTGTLTVDMKYEGLETWLALYAGADTVSGAAPTLHTITRKIDMTGIFFTLAWYDGVTMWEIDSCKFNSMSLTVTAGRVVAGTFGFFGRKLSVGAINTSASSWTEPTNIDRVQAINTSTITYTMAAQASSLAAFDCSMWKIDSTRAYKIDDLAYLFADGGYVKEVPAGALTWGGTLNIPYTATTHVTAAQAGTAFKLKLLHQLTSLKILSIYTPHVKITKCTPFNPGDKGEIPQVLTFVSNKALSVPSGMPATVGANPVFEVSNSNTANALAA